MARPEERYIKLETKKLPDGRTVYKSAKPIKVNSNPFSDIALPASDQLRMDVLANNAYGSAMDWWKIASVNGRVDGSLYFPKLGGQIIIPRGR